jgi:hypothetical protein
MMNNRERAEQIVFHPHIHPTPRYKNDGLKLWSHGSYKEGEAEVVQEKIRAHLSYFFIVKPAGASIVCAGPSRCNCRR